MTNKIKIQHYVPRFYLRNFSVRKGKNFLINCFDKPTKNVFLVDIRKIGCEKYFYDTSRGTNQSVEKTLGKFESKFNVTYEKIIEFGSLNSLTTDEKTSMAYFIATQWIRTREHREIIKDMIKQFTKRLSKEKLSEELEKQLNDLNREEVPKSLHLNSLENVPKYANIIRNMKWILFVNKTKTPYYTSDHPVTLFNSIDLKPYGNLGLSCEGIEMHFPLNPQLSLCVCDPVRYHLLSEKYETRDTQHIIFQNHLQVKWSTRHVFSYGDDFSLAEKMISEHPELKDVNRKRGSVN